MNEQPDTTAAGQGKSGALVYVVDDEPMLLELAFLILHPCGYQVKTFRDPCQALDCFNQANPRPALVIADYAMEGMDGLQLLEACREIQPRQPFLMVSGTVDAEFFRANAPKPNRFLAKPYQAKDLIDLVRLLIH